AGRARTRPCFSPQRPVLQASRRARTGCTGCTSKLLRTRPTRKRRRLSSASAFVPVTAMLGQNLRGSRETLARDRGRLGRFLQDRSSRDGGRGGDARSYGGRQRRART